MNKKKPSKRTIKTTHANPVPTNGKGPLLASLFFLALLLVFCWQPTIHLFRVYVHGDGIERLKCAFKIDGVSTKWAYSCWSGNPPARDLSNNSALGLQSLVFDVVKLPLLDHNSVGGPLNIDGKSFSTGIGAHAPSKIAFDLQGKYARFSCKAGLDKISGEGHGVVFTVVADGKEILRTPKLRTDAEPYPIDCPVAGMSELVICADNMEFDNTSSHVDWVDFKFEPEVSAAVR
jgi:hypothetical protein